MEEQNWMTMDQASKYLEVKKSTVYKLIKDGVLQGEKRDRQMEVASSSAEKAKEQRDKAKLDDTQRKTDWRAFCEIDDSVDDKQLAHIITDQLIKKGPAELILRGQELKINGEARVLGPTLAAEMALEWKKVETKAPFVQMIDDVPVHIRMSVLDAGSAVYKMEVEHNPLVLDGTHPALAFMKEHVKPGLTIFQSPGRTKLLWKILSLISLSRTVLVISRKKVYHIPSIIHMKIDESVENPYRIALQKALDFAPDVLVFDEGVPTEILNRACHALPVIMHTWAGNEVALVNQLNDAAAQLQAVIKEDATCQVEMLTPREDYLKRLTAEDGPVSPLLVRQPYD